MRTWTCTCRIWCVINYAGNEEAANKTVEEIKALGVNAKAKKFDVSNKEAVETAINEIFEEFKRIDVLVNNAGITRDNLFMRMKEDEWLFCNQHKSKLCIFCNPSSFKDYD